VLAPEAPITVELPTQIEASGVVVMVGGADALMVKLAEVVQLFASVTVTTYVPAARLLTDAVVWAGTVFHK
jgi:hypothetical protein